jgi:hypothetical protein
VAHLVAEMSQHLGRGHVSPPGVRAGLQTLESGEEALAIYWVEKVVRADLLFGNRAPGVCLTTPHKLQGGG